MSTPCLTISSLLELRQKDSVDNILPLIHSMKEAFTPPVRWQEPGDECEFIGDVSVGTAQSEGKIHIRFSKYGNLCGVTLPLHPVEPVEEVKRWLAQYGWTILPDEEAAWEPSPGVTIWDLFFSW